MATIATATAALRAKLEEVPSLTAFRWQGEDGGDLPDEPEPFAYVEFENFGPGRGPDAFGGGRGQSLYRNEGLVTVYVFRPNGEGLPATVTLAESIAARLRSFRSDDVSCFSASVHPIGKGENLKPPGLDSEVNSYMCAIVEIAFQFDQIG